MTPQSRDVDACEAIDPPDVPEDVAACDAPEGRHTCVASVHAGPTARIDVGVTVGGASDGLIRVWGLDSDGAVFVIRVGAGSAVRLRRALDRAIEVVDRGAAEPRGHADVAPVRRPGPPRGSVAP